MWWYLALEEGMLEEFIWSILIHCLPFSGLHFKEDFCGWVVIGRVSSLQEQLELVFTLRKQWLIPKSHFWPENLPSMPNQGEDCYFYFYSTCTKVRLASLNQFFLLFLKSYCLRFPYILNCLCCDLLSQLFYYLRSVF